MVAACPIPYIRVSNSCHRNSTTTPCNDCAHNSNVIKMCHSIKMVSNQDFLTQLCFCNYKLFHFKDDNGNHNKQLADAKEWFPSSGGKGKGRRKLTESSLNSEMTAKTAVKTVKSKMRWVHVDIVKGAAA